MKLFVICLTSLGEIAAVLAAVLLLSVACLAIARKFRAHFLAPALMIGILTAGMASSLGSGSVRTYALAFGMVAAIVLIFWERRTQDKALVPLVDDAHAQDALYPALVARVGEMRDPSAGELRQLLRRLRKEIRADGLSPSQTAQLTKQTARAAIRP